MITHPQNLQTGVKIRSDKELETFSLFVGYDKNNNDHIQVKKHLRRIRKTVC